MVWTSWTGWTRWGDRIELEEDAEGRRNQSWVGKGQGYGRRAGIWRRRHLGKRPAEPDS